MGKKNRKKKKNKTVQILIDAELKLRKKYTEFTGIEATLNFEYGLFTREEQLKKYAIEIAFWSSRWLFNDKIISSPHYHITNRLMLNGEMGTMEHMCEFYKDDEEMQNEIITLANITYFEKFGKPMNPMTLCMFNRFKTGDRRSLRD